MGRGSWQFRCLWVLGVCLAAGAAWADGGFVGKRGNMAEPEQKAVILFADGIEDLILQVQYDGAVEQCAPRRRLFGPPD